MPRMIATMLVLVLTTCLPGRSDAQVRAGLHESTTAPSPRWEVSLEVRVGVPTGYIRVSETVTHGTRLRLSDLGLDVSEAVEAGIAFWLTPRDAVRATYLYYFLRGSTTLDRSIAYDGQAYTAGAVATNADFSRISLAYERLLTTVLDHGRLIGSAGLTYVLLNAGLTQHGKTKAEDFYLQEMPVPILGLRFDYPLTQRLGLRASVAGGLRSTVCARRAGRSTPGRATPTRGSR